MKNPLIAERLKFYRKKNNLSVEQVSGVVNICAVFKPTKLSSFC